MDPGQNCTQCLDGSTSKDCSSINECQYPEIFCPIGATQCMKHAGRFECICSPGLKVNVRTSQCQIKNAIYLNISIDNYAYLTSYENRSSTAFLHLAKVVHEKLENLMQMSENYIDTTLDSVLTYKQGISTVVTLHVWSRAGSEIERIKTTIENYLLKCQTYCFSIPSSANLLSIRVASLCAINPNLCSNYQKTVCVDNMTFHHESSSSRQYACQCEAGFSSEQSYTANDGTIFVCRRVTSLCVPNPCGAIGKCTENTDGFHCQCPWTRTGLLCENALPVLLVIAMLFIALISVVLVSIFYWSGKKRENHIIITRQLTEQCPPRQQSPQEINQSVLNQGGITNQSFENIDSEVSGHLNQGTSYGRNTISDEARLVKEEEIMERSF